MSVHGCKVPQYDRAILAAGGEMLAGVREAHVPHLIRVLTQHIATHTGQAAPTHRRMRERVRAARVRVHVWVFTLGTCDPGTGCAGVVVCCDRCTADLDSAMLVTADEVSVAEGVEPREDTSLPQGEHAPSACVSRVCCG